MSEDDHSVAFFLEQHVSSPDDTSSYDTPGQIPEPLEVWVSAAAQG